MFQKCQQHSRLRFSNEYEQTLAKLRSELGEIIVKHVKNGTLISSMCFAEIWKIATTAARHLSNKRLELDIDALNKFGFTVQENARWLKENQSKLLLEDFWKQFVLTEYQKPVFNGKGTFGENQILNELKHILHQVEREIDVLESEPISVQQQQQSVTPQFVINGGQNNIAFGNSIQNINYGSDIQEAITKFVELLKESDLSKEFKEETINLAKNVAEQSKDGKPSESILKSFNEKLLAIKDPATTFSAVINVSTALYKTAAFLCERIIPLIPK